MEEDESKGIKSMSENLERMCPCYAEMDVLFGHKPNVTPIESSDSQEKDSLNGGDDDDFLLDKDNNGLESPLNLDPLLNNDDSLVQVENLQDNLQSKSIIHAIQKHNQAMTPNLNDKSGSAREINDNARLEWDRERWNEEKVRKMEKQRFEEVKLQKQMEFDENQQAKNHESEKEKWNRECDLKSSC
ncbi:hypothetical protein O181_130462 [Austropuccinia psidii MF-1]|uniref:Uncharacterized protein n=1 Tax=Austropuccinia psidii MF-1 TaxID=1389203 RepID=A0A9Q3L3U7_9BASI|nr:hypothetical protein [Austropuccinia psidii MF-1]